MFKMRPPAVSRRLRKLKKNFGMSAPRVVVRSHGPLRLPLLLVVVCLTGVLLGYGGFRWWQQRSDEIVASSELRAKYEFCSASLSRLQQEVGTDRQTALMELATQQQILRKSERLERENAQLREDLRTFEQLMAAPEGNAPVRIENFRLIGEGDGSYRYRLFFAFVPDKAISEFRGRMSMHVSYQLAGTEVETAIPEAGAGELRIRHYLRREGTFRLPEGAKLLAGEVKVFQGDVLKSRLSAQF